MKHVCDFIISLEVVIAFFLEEHLEVPEPSERLELDNWRAALCMVTK
jgi:hypothetical protein